MQSLCRQPATLGVATSLGRVAPAGHAAAAGGGARMLRPAHGPMSPTLGLYRAWGAYVRGRGGLHALFAGRPRHQRWGGVHAHSSLLRAVPARPVQLMGTRDVSAQTGLRCCPSQ